MSIADTQRLKELENKLAALENRLLMLEMQKRPVEAVGYPLDKEKLTRTRETLTLRGRAA